MPAKSQAQQRFFGLVRSVQRGDRPMNEVSESVQRAAKHMKPSDAREFAHTKRTGLPEQKRASFLDLLGFSVLLHKRADAQQLSKSVAGVAKSIQQLGANRRKQLDRDLKKLRGELDRERQGRSEMERQLKAHEDGVEERKLQLETQLNERRLQQELEADELRHQQQMKHEQERAHLEAYKTVRQAEIQAEAQRRELEALNGPAGPQAPTGQVPYGKMLTGDPEEEGKGGKKKP